MNLLTIILLAFTAISPFGARAMPDSDTTDSSCAWSACEENPQCPDFPYNVWKDRRCTLKDGNIGIQFFCCTPE
ncbi:uncharacterized protein EDB91DRAFT_1124515 [Suillus paluster]|uniref:uncharacterized protein n=1 Tax=Suillus paluster TaxID=48578 RepID=UPI001B85EA35|nr:uncharacterized protein EDB91DRAFT_1124515 [Suillus paluster]KAG1744102.1 hypothetical protein EDB91DRAFT_1124515 [Suillus paluster]